MPGNAAEPGRYRSGSSGPTARAGWARDVSCLGVVWSWEMRLDPFHRALSAQREDKQLLSAQLLLTMTGVCKAMLREAGHEEVMGQELFGFA